VFASWLGVAAYNVEGMMVKGEDYRGESSKCSSAVLKADLSMEKQITELASSSVADMESMRRLVELLCKPNVDAKLANIAHVVFARGFDPSLVDAEYYAKCIHMINDINFHKNIEKDTLSSFFLHQYNSGAYSSVSSGPEESPEDYM
jgi:hypothetical protein